MELDESDDGFGAAVGGSAGVEVGHERLAPLPQRAAESSDLGDRAGRELFDDLDGDLLPFTLAPAIRQMLRRVLAGRAAMIITHDVLDALLLVDRVIVMESGRVVEDGPTKEVLTRPRSTFGARIAGLNMVVGVAAGRGVRTDEGLVIEGSPTSRSPTVLPLWRCAARSQLPFSSSHRREAPRNLVAVTITELEPHGEQVTLRTGTLSAEVTLAAVTELDLLPGSQVFFVIKANEVSVYPR